MVGSERGSMEELRGQIFTVLGIYEVTILLHSYIMKYERAYCILRNETKQNKMNNHVLK